MTEPTRVTLDDLHQAQADATRWDEAWANDTSNNPDKFYSQRRDAHRRVRELTRQLKAQGDLPMTEHERRCVTLDALAPNARSGQIVEFEGGRYRRRFFPEEKSRSGKTVTAWSRTWESLSPPG